MLIIEKVLLLRATDIFKDTMEQDLIDTAMALEELEMEAGTAIFLKGDEGNCMYIIKKGEVRIHDEEHVFAVLKENDIFGELSLLDTETRSATATCETDCLLLKLDQEVFFEIMSGNVNVLKGILKTLARRIRALDIKSTKLNKMLRQQE